MKRFAIFLASLVAGYIFASFALVAIVVVANPFADMGYSAGVSARGVVVLVLMIVFARLVYESFTKRWLAPIVPIAPPAKG